MELSFIQDENTVEHIDGITYDFPYTMHERDLTGYTVPWHWHEELEFNYAYRGSIEIETIGHTYTIHQGEGYFINTNVMDTKRRAAGCKTAIEHAHLFHPILLTGHYRSVFQTKYLDPVLKDQSIEILIIREDTKSGKEFLAVLHRLTQLYGQENTEFEVRSLLSQAWLALMREIELQKCSRKTQAPHLQSRVKDILSFIHKYYGEKITIADIAAHTNISTRECIRSFKNTVHQPPMDYLIHYRIEQAKRLLRESDMSITEIAFQTGFQNSAYFGKTFKKFTGVTPSAFRSADAGRGVCLVCEREQAIR